MIIKIQEGLIKKALADGEIVQAVPGRPNLPQIDLAKVTFTYYPSSADHPHGNVRWVGIAAFMKEQLDAGFLTLGTREWVSILCNSKVHEWLREQPGICPWRFENGGPIGFPDGLIKEKGPRLSYNVAVWINSVDDWFMRRLYAVKKDKVFPEWRNYLRLAMYPLN